MQHVVPYLTVKDAAKAIAFYQKAFNAKENSRAPAEDGKRLMHADLSINGGTVFVMDEFPEFSAQSGQAPVQAPTQEKPSAVAMVINYASPPEIDAAHRRAVEAGCTSLMQPQDTFWKARFAVVGDPYGHRWMLNAALPG